jgi:hypothetical protein
MNKCTRVTAGAVLAAGLGSLAYPLFFRDWCLSWGARPDEAGPGTSARRTGVRPGMRRRWPGPSGWAIRWPRMPSSPSG